MQVKLVVGTWAVNSMTMRGMCEANGLRILECNQCFSERRIKRKHHAGHVCQQTPCEIEVKDDSMVNIINVSVI